MGKAIAHKWDSGKTHKNSQAVSVSSNQDDVDNIALDVPGSVAVSK